MKETEQNKAKKRPKIFNPKDIDIKICGNSLEDIRKDKNSGMNI